MPIPKLIRYQDNSFVTSQGTLLEGFETFADWTIAGGVGSADSTHRKQGLQSLRLDTTTSLVSRATKTISEDLSAVTNFIVWVYIHNRDSLTYWQIHFSSVTDWSKWVQGHISKSDLKPGWNRIAIAKSQFTSQGGESWSNTMIRLRIWVDSQTAGVSTVINVDDLRCDHAAKAKCMLHFDDCCQNQYDLAKPIMDGNGQVGATFCPTSWVGTPGDHLTKAQLTTMQAAGWDISNHTAGHPDLTAISQVAMEEIIDEGYDWLVANGFGNGARFFAYPYGSYSQAVITKVRERHRIGRSVHHPYLQAHFDLNDDNIDFLVKARSVIRTETPATIQGWIDNTIAHKGLLILLFHHIVEGEPGADNQYNINDFETISNYLKTKEDAEDIDVITFSDYYDQFMPTDLTSVVYLEHGPLVPYPIAYNPSESVGRAEDRKLKVYKHPLAGDRKRLWRIKCIIDNSGSSGYRWRDLEYFYTKVVEGAKRPCVFVDANSVQYLVRIIDFAPKAIGLNNRHEVTMILEEDYS